MANAPQAGDDAPATRGRSLRRARKRFGQHFLTDRRALMRIADALAIDRSATVLEIGPGRGALTDLLAERAARVIAIEIDRDLAALLRARYDDNHTVQIVEGDAVRMDWGALAGPDFLLVGNLPYNLTTPLLFKALSRPLPRRSVFLVQSEVADRIVADEGSKEYGALSVNVRIATEAEVIARVRSTAFAPRPTVDSAIIRLTPRTTPLVSDEHVPDFRAFVQAIFSLRRKQVQRALRSLGVASAAAATALLAAIGVLPADRAETLSPERFVLLFHAWQRLVKARPTDPVVKTRRRLGT
jgi:16S rRNA (adenine1518-N6/adenine1519-N6)-dimethyltransferase